MNQGNLSSSQINNAGSGIQAGTGSGSDMSWFLPATNFVIEASAGTGKTYTIIEILKKLLSRNSAANQKASLDQILVVTYTEKAAGELKDRIRKMWEKSKDEIDLSSDEIDRAMIGTIHSFCQKSIEEFSVATGRPSGLMVIDEDECEHFVRKYIREGKLFDTIQAYKRDKPGDNSIEEKLVKYATALIEKYYLDSNFCEVSSIVKIDPVDKFCSGIGSIKEVINSISRDIAVLKASSEPVANEIAKECSASTNLATVRNKYGRKKSWTECREKLTDPEKEAYDQVMDCINRCEKYAHETSEKKDMAAQTMVIAYAQDIYQKWIEEKADHAEQTFNDMIRNVREDVMKNSSRLKEKLQEKYKYVIIDEFQDTNQKQWDIFSNVFLDNNHYMIVVGDPKQSIYSFQGADVHVYEKAKADLINKHNAAFHTLAVNYRSSDSMIDSVNRFFSNKKALNHFSSSLFQGVCYARYKGNDVPAFWICKNEDVSDFPAIACRKIVECCEEDPDNPGNTNLMLVEVKDGVPQKPEKVHFSDFAILARTRSEMRVYTQALKNCGIPYIQYKEDTLLSGQECAQWVALLEALDQPDFSGKNRAFLKKTMLTPFFGYSMSDLNDICFERDDLNELGYFEKWKTFIPDGDWEGLFESIVADTNLEKNLSSPSDIHTLCILKQIGEYCLEYLSTGKTLTQLVIHLKKHLRKATDSGEETIDENEGIVAKGTDFDCVKVMTIHASKGLEFPIVISVAGQSNLKSSSTIYNYHDRYNQNLLSFAKTVNYEREICQEWQRLIYVDYTRAKYILMLPEFDPLDYFPFISSSIDAYTKKSANCYEPLKKDASVTIGDLRKRTSLILAANHPSGDTLAEREEQQKKIKALIADNSSHLSYKHAYSSLSHNDTKTEQMTDEKLLRDTEDQAETELIEDEQTDEVYEDTLDLSEFDRNALPADMSGFYDREAGSEELSDDFPKGANLGNALHKIFEVIDYWQKDSVNPEQYSDNVSDALIETAFRDSNLNCKKQWIKDVRTIIKNVLYAKLPEIRGSNALTQEFFSLSELPMEQRRNEIEFNFNIEADHMFRNYFNGFVDLIVQRTTDGGTYYSIFDWKSDRQKTYSNGKTLKNRVDRQYSIQRVLYAYALIRHLTEAYRDAGENVTADDVFERNFGGIYYVFLRGCKAGTGNGIYAQTWNTYTDLENAYKKILKECFRKSKEEKKGGE